VRSVNFLLTHANDSHGGSFFLPPFVCICLVLSAKTVRITKPDIEMLHDESWKRIYCPVKPRVTIIASVGFCTLVSAGFYLIMQYPVYDTISKPQLAIQSKFPP